MQSIMSRRVLVPARERRIPRSEIMNNRDACKIVLRLGQFYSYVSPLYNTYAHGEVTSLDSRTERTTDARAQHGAQHLVI